MQKEIFSQIWKFSQQATTSEELVYNLCNYFLGAPYKLLAEPKCTALTIQQLLEFLAYDDQFTVDLTSFDCVTFVETILAIVLAKIAINLESFMQIVRNNLLSLQYQHGIVSFLRRNHYFMCVDWIPNNQWVVTDITKQLEAKPLIATTYINKVTWLYNSNLLASYKEQITIAEFTSLLQKFKFFKLGQDSCLAYISIIDVLTNYAKYLELLPVVSIICIVRPNWDPMQLFPNYGTKLNISHLGIAFKQQNELYFYHATSITPKAVTVVKLKDYLTKYLDSSTIKGITILQCKF